MKRTVAYLSDFEYDKLRARAGREDRSMSDLIRDLINRPPLVISFGEDLSADQVTRIRAILKEKP